MTQSKHKAARCAVCDYHPMLSSGEESRHVLWDETHQEYICQFCYTSIADTLWDFEVEDEKDFNATAPRKPVQPDPKASSIGTSQTVTMPASEPPKGNPCGDSECGRFCECKDT